MPLLFAMLKWTHSEVYKKMCLNPVGFSNLNRLASVSTRTGCLSWFMWLVGILTFQNKKQWPQIKTPVCINSLQHTSIHGSLSLNKIKCSKVCEWKFSTIPPVPAGAGCSQLSAWAWGGNLFQRFFWERLYIVWKPFRRLLASGYTSFGGDSVSCFLNILEIKPCPWMP